MSPLLEIIRDAESRGVAVGHFNVSDLTTLRAVTRAAFDLGAETGRDIPLIIGTSEGERAYLGARTIVSLVSELRASYAARIGRLFPLFLNADHTRSLEGVREAVEAGYDAVLFDGGALPFGENVRRSAEAAAYIRSTRPEVVFEGELGYIGSSSALLDDLPEGAAVRAEDLTRPDEARLFADETGIQLLAPAVGNLHGMLKGGANPKIDTERIRAIRRVIEVPLVLHGGSGVRDEEFTAAIDAGVSTIHISTELRLAWRRGIEGGLAHSPDEIAPYKILPSAEEAVYRVAIERLKLFNKLVY